MKAKDFVGSIIWVSVAWFSIQHKNNKIIKHGDTLYYRIFMFSIVYITTGNMDEAKQIARILVEKKLAACVNMFPVTSIYRWDGIQEDYEVAMIVKTTYEQIEQIEKAVKEIHSYTVPCIISFSIDGGSRDYLQWIDDNVTPLGIIKKDDS